MANRLQFEKSPYLLQHKDNPVDWYSWCGEAFERAKAEDKPIFLSIGYSTCHWCHVMAHESFENEQIASILNRDFIAVKVDREERPDIDSVYMDACLALNGSGGWPLTLLLTPEQKPFYAGTYLPQKDLVSLLLQAAKLWREDKAGLLEAGEQLTAHLTKEAQSAASLSAPGDLIFRAVKLFSQTYDPKYGGFGKAPKFPSPHNLLFLLKYSQESDEKFPLEMAKNTLNSMYRGGLFDHIGGGFCRYSTDSRWLVPHFEKMLYDNALLLLTYAEAYASTKNPLYQSVAMRTADYVLTELTNADGAFFCGQDADSDGQEGKYYLLSKAEILRLLGKDAGMHFCAWYGITEEGNFDGQNIPNLLDNKNYEQEPANTESLRKSTYAYRLTRTRLSTDDKVLTSWNGLMIAALSRCGFLFHEPKFRNAARKAQQFIQANLETDSGALLSRYRDGHAAFCGKLNDYAFYVWGVLELYQATFDIAFLQEAVQKSDILLDEFFDRDNGGFYPYSSKDELLISRKKETYDGAIPSGNSVCALILSRLSRLTGEAKWRETAEKQFSFLKGAMEAYPAGYGFGLLALMEEIYSTAELICTTDKNEIPEELLRFLSTIQAKKTNLTALVKTPENSAILGRLAPFTENYKIENSKTMYYLCQNHTCSNPVSTIAELEKVLFEKQVSV